MFIEPLGGDKALRKSTATHTISTVPKCPPTPLSRSKYSRCAHSSPLNPLNNEIMTSNNMLNSK